MSGSVGLFLFCGVFWFVLVPSLAVGICSSDVMNLELAALLLWSLYALVACRASLPCMHLFHLFRVNAVSLVSLTAKASGGFGVFCFLWWVFVLLLCFWLVWSGFLLFLFCLCFFACLRSFTDWCIAHRQQSREQKKQKTALDAEDCVSRRNLT